MHPLLTFLPGAIRQTRFGLLALSWFGAVVAIIAGPNGDILVDAAACGFALFFIITIPRLRWDSLLILAVLAAVSVMLLTHVPAPHEWIEGISHVLIFAALLPTMSMVRSTAMTMPSVHETQKRLTALPLHASASGLQVAGHVFGGIINTGAFALLSAAVRDDSTDSARRMAAEAAIRGMVSSAAWSPFFVAFAIGQNFVASHHAWAAIGIGFITAALFTIISLKILHSHFVFGQLVQALRCMAPVGLRLVIVLAAVLLAALLFNLTALSAVVTVMPLLVLIQMIRHPSSLRMILRETRDSMDHTADDIVIITAAMLVAFFALQTDVIQVVVTQLYNGMIPGWFALIATPVLMMIGSVFGIHPVITSTGLLTIFSGGGADVHPALLVQAHLIGWGAGTMSSVASLSVISCSSLYGVPTRRLALGQNLKTGFFYALGGGILLSLANAWV